MPACHAGGHEFESRTHRKEAFHYGRLFCVLMFLSPNNLLAVVDVRRVGRQRLQLAPQHVIVVTNGLRTLTEPLTDRCRLVGHLTISRSTTLPTICSR